VPEALEPQVGAVVRRTTRAVADSRRLLEKTDRQLEASSDRARRSLRTLGLLPPDVAPRRHRG
jgi:hypothetical protein